MTHDPAAQIRPWNHQAFVLRRLQKSIASLLESDAHLSAGQTVVDLGCGTQPYRALVEARGARYVGCDLASPADVIWNAADGEPVPLEAASCDGVLSSQVLEHVWDTSSYLAECRRLLKPGGWLLLSTHGVWPYHPHPADYHRWTRDGLVKELQSAGFEVTKVDPLVGPLEWTTQVRLLGAHYLLNRIPLVGRPLLAVLALLMNTRMSLEEALTPAAVRETNAAVYVTLSRRLP